MNLENITYDGLKKQLDIIWNIGLVNSFKLVKKGAQYDVNTGNMVESLTTLLEFKGIMYTSTSSVFKDADHYLGQGNFKTSPYIIYASPREVDLIDLHSKLSIDSIIQKGNNSYSVKEVSPLPDLDNIFTIRIGCMHN